MKPFEQEVLHFIQNEHMLPKGCTVIAGVSGGADSVCLLTVLCRLRRLLQTDLQVVHVHHGIREEADADAAFVEGLCESAGVPCHIARYDVPAMAKAQGLGEEEAGRRARYEAYQRAAKEVKGEVRIATAHTADDAAETVLFHLLRGTGLDGAAGILPVRENIVRPLLHVTRVQIEGYLNAEGISWREDATNASDAYTRNRIRHDILPAAAEVVNAQASKHLAQAGETFALTAAYIRQQAQALLEACAVAERPGAVFVPEFQKAPFILRQEAVRIRLKELTPHLKDIGRAHIDAVVRLCEDTAGVKELSLPGGIRVVRERKVLYFERDADG